jgi:mRNA interferase HigB
MRVFSKKTITDYGNSNAQAKEELAIWYSKVEAADWTNLNEIKADMPSTDYIADNRYVFNVKGNKYRVVAMVFFPSKQVYIRGIYTHAEYSKLSKKQLAEL